MLNSLFLLNFSIVGIPIVQHNSQSISFEQISCSIKMPAVFHFVLMGIHLFIFEKKKFVPCLFILFWIVFISSMSNSMQCKLATAFAAVFVENSQFIHFVNDNYFGVDKNCPLCDCGGTI